MLPRFLRLRAAKHQHVEGGQVRIVEAVDGAVVVVGDVDAARRTAAPVGLEGEGDALALAGLGGDGEAAVRDVDRQMGVAVEPGVAVSDGRLAQFRRAWSFQSS